MINPVFKFFYSILTFIQEFYWNFGQFCRGNLCHCKDVLQYLTPDLWKASFDGNYRILVLNLVNSKTINRNQNQKFIYVIKNNTYIVWIKYELSNIQKRLKRKAKRKMHILVLNLLNSKRINWNQKFIYLIKNNMQHDY